jgi:hypothetical protein
VFADKELIITILDMTDCPLPSTQAETINYGTNEISTTEKHTMSYARKYYL